MSEQNVNILMTGGGAPGAAGIIKCLRQEKTYKIIVADANPEVVGKYLGDHFETIPLATAPDFIEHVLAICRKNNIHVIIPLVTKELIPFSERVSEFEAIGVKLICSSHSSLEIANNKCRLYEFLEWRGIAVPAYKIVETIEQLKLAVKELGYPEKQLCFKPCVANGSRGFRILSEDFNTLEHFINQKPDHTYISFDDAINVLSSGKFPELLVAEYLPGEEYSVDCLAKDGVAVLIIPRIRKKMINGISVEGEIIEEKSIVSYCEQIIEALQLHGNVGIQVKRSGEGSFLILEINPRVQGTISAILGAGVNLPVLAVKQELGLQIAPEELKVKWGTKFFRYWNEVFY